ncbi:MAG: cellulase family glycosylhydrolase [Draconibacterium sp.]|nr:cellulase family glycosylhydrolase [Draconibacterium sp.]
MNTKIVLLFLFTLTIQHFSSGQKAKNNASFQNSFVKISTQNPFYFELTNGETYIPVGPNLCWAKDMDTLESYFKKLAENGGNFARIWLNFPGQEIETEYGKVNEINAKNLDRILEMAVKYNIKIKLCIESFRQISVETTFFSKTQYHTSKGGPFENMEEYINTEKGKQAFLNRLAMLKEKFGNHPAIFGWELWNEMNAISSTGVAEWNEIMLPRVHEMFPENMVMQSLGSFDSDGARDIYRTINRLPSNDVAQIHRYLDLGASLDICKAPMDLLASDAIDELRSYEVEKPMLLAEVGGVKPRHTGPIELYEVDKDGILLHDLLFAPFFSGAAGPGHAWHWDSYIDKNNLWYHYHRFSEAIKGIDPVQEKFIPVKIEHPKLRIYGLIGNKTILLWCRDTENDWENEFTKGVSPDMLSGLSVDISGLLAKNTIKANTIYDPWKNEWKRGKKQSVVVLPDFKRSMVVRINRK